MVKDVDWDNPVGHMRGADTHVDLQTALAVGQIVYGKYGGTLVGITVDVIEADAIVGAVSVIEPPTEQVDDLRVGDRVRLPHRLRAGIEN